eukprot:scaffold34265_cov58-Attheya_sp.AAC.7
MRMISQVRRNNRSCNGPGKNEYRRPVEDDSLNLSPKILDCELVDNVCWYIWVLRLTGCASLSNSSYEKISEDFLAGAVRGRTQICARF